MMRIQKEALEQCGLVGTLLLLLAACYCLLSCLKRCNKAKVGGQSGFGQELPCTHLQQSRPGHH
jgi:O-antigen ligase